MSPRAWERGCRRLRRVRDDSGAILIIAIAIVTVVAVVVGALLTRGDGSLRATVKLRQVAGSTYAADGAGQLAINALRTGYHPGGQEPASWTFTNEDIPAVPGLPEGCFGWNGSNQPDSDLSLPSFYPASKSSNQAATSAHVTCTPEDDTGAQGPPVRINDANKPGNAILTLSTDPAEHGFTFKSNGSGAAFRVKGGIWSNSDINRDNNGVLESTESIRAHTGCTPANAMSAPVVDCSAATAPDPDYKSDPDIADGAAGDGVVPTYRTPPASCPNNGSITLQPGYYDDVAKLNNLTDTNQTCFVHIQPGTYYFDFHNDGGISDPLFDSDIASNAGNVWRIGSRKTIVAGTLTSDTTVPGRCVNPIDDETAQGVQFIFGATSRMAINATGQDTSVEICGTWQLTRPPIAIYGLKSGTAASTVIPPTSALTTSGTPTVSTAGTGGTFVQATAANLQTANGVEATNANLAYWQRTGAGGNNNQTQSITMAGFGPATTIPAGSVLTGARLKVTHKSTGQPNAITVTPNLGTGPISYTLPARSALGTEDIDLSARAGWGAFQKAVHDNGYTGASVQFSSTLGQNQLAQLDAVRLELTYYVPQWRQQSGTVAATNGANLIQVSGNTAFLYIQGTTYVPRSSINLEMNNLQESVFRFGVIARSLSVFQTGSFAFVGAVIELPDNSVGLGFKSTIVRLDVDVCPNSSSCSHTSTPDLTARVQLWAPSGSPTKNKRQIRILSWSHKR